MQFADLNLNTPLLNALSDLGLTTPTTIQQKVFPIAMSGKDVCGIAQTGTGKTYAYLLACLKQWKFSKEKHPQILVVVPTRELVTQVVDEVKKLTTYMNVVAVGVYGGVNMNTQKIAVENGMDVLVATPGRLIDLIFAGAIKTKNIKKLVIDEMDEMLNLGFRTQLKNIFELLPPKRQNLLFSATITDEVEQILDVYFNSPIRIEAAPTGTPLTNIVQQGYYLPNFYTKVNMLKYLFQQDESMSKVLVFVDSKKLADEVFDELFHLYENKMGVIHSNKEQNHRFNTVNKFKDGTYRFIIATDIVARGLDIAEVTHVINFDLPDVPENYMHRIGRTGRADKKGIAISFVTDKEQKFLNKIENLMNYAVPFSELPLDLEISTELTEDEKPKKPIVKEVQLKEKKRDDVGPAFHEKSAKNSRTYKKVSYKDKMRAKYGKPKTRGQKK
ncbi:MAG: DEAD/DEAH box helicase [Chitinophagaceae bacterium]|jgi:ATP-dependent RNA helicase RhlE|nr:DEAD/DEAH box helicase [Chitinophagaceae bacterium]